MKVAPVSVPPMPHWSTRVNQTTNQPTTVLAITLHVQARDSCLMLKLCSFVNGNYKSEWLLFSLTTFWDVSQNVLPFLLLSCTDTHTLTYTHWHTHTQSHLVHLVYLHYKLHRYVFVNVIIKHHSNTGYSAKIKCSPLDNSHSWHLRWQYQSAACCLWGWHEADDVTSPSYWVIVLIGCNWAMHWAPTSIHWASGGMMEVESEGVVVDVVEVVVLMVVAVMEVEVVVLDV